MKECEIRKTTHPTKPKEDLREVTRSNLNIFRRKLSGNIARKI